VLENAIVGPFASIGHSTKIVNSNVKNSIIQNNSSIENCVIDNSMVGAYAEIKQSKLDLSVSDYSVYKV
jgi:glucose-1-phosphate thymidylyltransferase